MRHMAFVLGSFAYKNYSIGGSRSTAANFSKVVRQSNGSRSVLTCSFSTYSSTPASKLRQLLKEDDFLLMPCCYDALSAKLIERNGFKLSFMSGFGVSALHGLPDTGLLSYGEIVSQLRFITEAVNIPIIADGDTGYGNAMSVKRTVKGFANAGAAGIMLEDQLNPKRCGHTRGKSVVSREEAELRIRAAVDAREEMGRDIVIMARTDALYSHSLEEAIVRLKTFRKQGADILFMEAPSSVEQMKVFCQQVEGPKMANMVEQGTTPILPPNELAAMGYKIAAYPLTLLSASMKAMEEALEALQSGDPYKVQPLLHDFSRVCDMVGFDHYYEEEKKYAT
ncbi:hypothetical protein GpartN1_g5676.t1 [Galdieria partita]|uniref:Carboxyvinyl-carboxyphosphonate phosphorylmutase n=1 Tax=Galdieria partita TaxID=83374 RepID=A0A9C7USX2_9RHOD|nr:hypothetical protein GpartN1_g5676.t1 [Galdieria partita]